MTEVRVFDKNLTVTSSSDDERAAMQRALNKEQAGALFLRLSSENAAFRAREILRQLGPK